MFNLVIKVVSAVHTFLLRAFRGRVFGHLGGAPILLLTTVGRASGQSRTVPLLYLRDTGRSIVIASKGGYSSDPDWYRNLVAHPEATVQLGDQTISVSVSVLTGEERQRLWAEATRLYPSYVDYARRTSRELPVVALTPR